MFSKASTVICSQKIYFRETHVFVSAGEKKNVLARRNPQDWGWQVKNQKFVWHPAVLAAGVWDVYLCLKSCVLDKCRENSACPDPSLLLCLVLVSLVCLCIHKVFHAYFA